MMFIVGFIASWFLLGIFFYMREGMGSWNIWKTNWDTIVMRLPAIPIILLIAIIEEKILKSKIR